MWLPAKLKRDRQVALRLLDKGMPASTGSLEGSYELTDKGREFLDANVQALAPPTLDSALPKDVPGG